MTKSNADSESTPTRKPKDPTQATLLVRLAQESYELVHGPEGDPYALRHGLPPIALGFRNGRTSLRRELAASYLAQMNAAPSSGSLTDALGTLEGLAGQGREIDPSLRVGRAPDGRIVLDLGRRDGLAAIIAADGWRLEPTPIPFRRTALTAEMPEPISPGSVEALWSLVNVTTADRPLLLAYLVAAFIPEVDHPILGLFGEAGAGKSTAARAIAQILDPSPAPLRATPRDLNDWVVAAYASWVIAIDNASKIDPWFSDALCRASTGEGLVRRKLHTDSEITSIQLRRVSILTSIDPGALRGDLADRLVAAELERIERAERQSEIVFAQLLESKRPEVLGGLLTLTAKVVAELPNVGKLALPRLGGFGEIVAAVDLVLGTDGYARLAGLEHRLAVDVLEGDEVGIAIVQALEGFLDAPELRGTARELLEMLRPERPPFTWPRTERMLAARIRKIAPQLRACGYTVDFERDGSDSKRSRVWRIASQMPVGETSSDTSELSETLHPSQKSVGRSSDDVPDFGRSPSDDSDDLDDVPTGTPGAAIPLPYRDSASSSDVSDEPDDVITLESSREGRGSAARGSLEWLGTATAAELEEYARELDGEAPA